MGKPGSALVCIGLLAYFSTARAAPLEDVIAKNRVGSLEGYERLLSSVGESTPSRKLKQQESDVNKALLVASRDGDRSAVQRLLNSGADPNYVDPTGTLSPLMAAAASNQAFVIPPLVQAGASLWKEVNGMTPLQAAVGFGSADVVSVLITVGVDPNSAMIMAAFRNAAAVLQALIQGGGDVNLVDNGFTVLSVAAFLGHEESIDVLVGNGADKTKTGGTGATPREILCGCTLADEKIDECQFEKCKSPQRMISLLS